MRYISDGLVAFEPAVSERQYQERVSGVDAARWKVGTPGSVENNLAVRRFEEIDRVQPASPLLAAMEYHRWHCPGCDREVDTWKAVACPHCGDKLAVPF